MTSKTNSNLATDVTETLIARVRQEAAESLDDSSAYAPRVRELLIDAADHLSALHQERDEAREERNALCDIGMLDVTGPISDPIEAFRGMAARLAESRDQLKHENRALQQRAEAAEQERDEAERKVRIALHMNTKLVRGEFTQICSHCGFFEAPADGGWEALQAHIRECPKHPLRAAAAENKALKAQLTKIAEMKLCRVTGIMDLHLYACPYCQARAALTASPSDPETP